MRVLWPFTNEWRAYQDGYYRIGPINCTLGDEINVGGHVFTPVRPGIVIGVRLLCGHPVKLVYLDGGELAPDA
jgi:hypothetical protein